MKKFVSGLLLAAASAAADAAPEQCQVQMSQYEYNAYQAGVTATSPAAKAAAFEAYLTKYPNSSVKTEALNQILFADSQTGD